LVGDRCCVARPEVGSHANSTRLTALFERLWAQGSGGLASMAARSRALLGSLQLSAARSEL
jgi:hypothetical protein